MPDYYYHLCENIMVSITSVDTFGLSKYRVLIDDIAKTVTININVTENGIYNVFVYGTRKDIEAMKSNFELEPLQKSKLESVMQSCKESSPCGYCKNCSP